MTGSVFKQKSAFAIAVVSGLSTAVTFAATPQQRWNLIAAEELVREFNIDGRARSEFVAIYSAYALERLALWERECTADGSVRGQGAPHPLDKEIAAAYLESIAEINARRAALAERLSKELQRILTVETAASVVSADRFRMQFAKCPDSNVGTR